jgi:hypothetical protein
METNKSYLILGASLASFIVVLPRDLVPVFDVVWKIALSLVITAGVFIFFSGVTFENFKSFTVSAIRSVLLFYIFSFHILAISLFLYVHEFDYETRDFVFLILALQCGLGLLILVMKFIWGGRKKGSH